MPRQKAEEKKTEGDCQKSYAAHLKAEPKMHRMARGAAKMVLNIRPSVRGQHGVLERTLLGGYIVEVEARGQAGIVIRARNH